MRKAQLGMFDTTYVEWADRGMSTDFVLWWAFRPDGDVDAAGVIEHLKSRIIASDVLNRRLQHVPGHLDYPYWVHGVADIDAALDVEPCARMSWSECTDRMLELVVEPIDVTVVPFSFRVFPRVDDVIGADGPCLVVAMTASHTIFAGQATGPLGEYLWGPAGSELTIPGLPEATRNYTTVWALARSIRAVRQTAASIWHLLTAKEPAPAAIERVEWLGGDYWSQGERRQIATVAVDVPKGSSYTVTQLWAASIPRALARFHDDDAHGVVTVSMPVAVPYESLMGTNNLMFVVLPVTPEGSTEKQLDWVRDEMRAQIGVHMGEVGLAMASVGKRIPRYAQRMAMNSNARLQTGDTVLSSMRYTPKAPWTADGRPLVRAGFVPAKNIGTLVHAVWTAGDSMTIAVAAWPRDPDGAERYLGFLVEEFESLVLATPKANR
ncbi:hypothetical protein [Smaragdicoccus niigatensis]|uniref:hypothetical protein n=1 Tax=Smaragdicoccus niigatensis TaxID=359359 RepID=UPI000364C4C1|nr:hypothetical protein [Smaragdicoccus niigatensis]